MMMTSCLEESPDSLLSYFGVHLYCKKGTKLSERPVNSCYGLDLAENIYKGMLCESDIFFLKAHFNMNQRKSPARLSESSAFHPPLRWLSWNKSKGCFSEFPTGLSYNSIFFCRVDGWEAEQTKPKKISGPIQSDRVVDRVTSHSFQPKPVKSLQKHWREVQFGCQLFHMLCLSMCCVTAGENRGQSLSQRSQITLQGKVCPKYPKLRSWTLFLSKLDCAKIKVSHTQRHIINAAVFMFSQSLCFYLLCQRTLSVFLFSAITCLLRFCLYLGANHRLKKEVVVKQHAVSSNVCYTMSVLH